MTESVKSNKPKLGQKLLDGLNFELRTLLNGFVGPMQFLKYKLDDHSLVDIFRMLDTSMSRLERLTIRTAIVNNIEKDFTDLEKKNVNLVDVVRFSILELQPIADLENIKITIPNEQMEVSVQGDYNLLLQAFQIFLELAISLSTSDSSIDVSFISTSNEAQCLFSSDNVNFPVGINNQIDEEFIMTDLSWDISLAKTILYHHNARSIVTSSGSHNSTICITFKND